MKKLGVIDKEKKHNHKECICGRAEDGVCKCECEVCEANNEALPVGCNCEGCDCQK